jgi:hypothetical protein
MTSATQLIPWSLAYKEALLTSGSLNQVKNPTYTWIKSILLAEHSPIRVPTYEIVWDSIPYWISVHLVRHHVGVQPFVSTQRVDRTGENRDDKPQGSIVSMSMILNANAIINISRKRLCVKASKETRDYWKQAVAAITGVDPVLGECCVPECVYRGFCPERKSCGYSTTVQFKEDLDTYRNINEIKS